MHRALRLLVPAATLLAVTACGSGGGSAAGDQQAPAADKPAGPAAGGDGHRKEEPLTGETKQKAEQAALAKYPGTVVKSEKDAERPGMLAVEIKQGNGQRVEVYLDQNYQVSGAKQEGQENGKDDGDGN